MRKIDKFTNLYPVSKTIRFKAIPIGKTYDNISAKRLLEEDSERAEKYKKAKKILDRFHVEFIDKAMEKLSLPQLEEYADIFCFKSRNDAEKAKMSELETEMRKQIAKTFADDEVFGILFKKEIIAKVMSDFLTETEEKDILASFANFYTAFTGYNDTRKNLYSADEISVSIAYRLINENLPRFLNNLSIFSKVRDILSDADIEKIEKELELSPYYLKDLFTVDFFPMAANGKGIDFYNMVLGGKSQSDGTKIKGLNEYINLYNQQLPQNEKNRRLPSLQPLYKLILSDKESFSFVDEEFESDQAVLATIRTMLGVESSISKSIDKLCELLSGLSEFDADGLYIKNGAYLTGMSNGILGAWNAISVAWNKEYDSVKMKTTPKDMEVYEEQRRKALNGISSFSFAEVDELIRSSSLYDESKENLCDYFKREIVELVQKMSLARNAASPIYAGDYSEEKSLATDDIAIGLIKDYLDSIKNIETFVKGIMISGKEENIDEVFYGQFVPLFDEISTIDRLYNRVRNYVTRKPYSDEKYKLYFQNPQFLGGWDRNKVSDYRSTLLKKDGKYYLLVIDKGCSKILNSISESKSADNYELIDYKMISGASKSLPKVFFLKNDMTCYGATDEVIKIYKEKTFAKSSGHFVLSDCHKLIDYYKSAINQYPWGEEFNFHFSPTSSYADINEFFKEVDEQGYKIAYTKVDKEQIDNLVDEGKIYLFQLYSKDFSKYSHGTPNLHTMLFVQAMEGNGNIKLCGGAELFFRKASIGKADRVIHPANKAIDNKNVQNPKHTSLFNYDIIKDKRYTTDQFEFHVPITLNRCSQNKKRINEDVRVALKEDENPYIIGIDRGERNLLYICVIDGAGKIVEQMSLNEIINKYNNVEKRTDYHDLLERKERLRKSARQDWTGIENIKELKDGYISQVVHIICELVRKYDAVIAMEDLNSGFKNSRVKVEKQVYQKFEKALIDKLNYLSFKDIAINELGSVSCGYQLSECFESFKRMSTQNGFIFYIPAWLTSKIDPVTGFADLLKPKYTNIEEARKLIMSFDKITYNEEKGYFEFDLDYTKFAKSEADHLKKWKICSYGDRVRTFRNSLNNNEWDNQIVKLTDEFVALFKKYNVQYSVGDIRDKMCNPTVKDYYASLIQLIRLTLQMRNSITGRTDVDYIISPVCDENGIFYDSRCCNSDLPQDADANGAYNIARKVLWAIGEFRKADYSEIARTKIAISNKQWLEFVQAKNDGK